MKQPRVLKWSFAPRRPRDLRPAVAAPGRASRPIRRLAAGPTADDIAARVQKFYDSTKTFKATFTQTYTIKVQNVKKVSTGKVIFEKPGKMSFIYDAPNGNRVVSDGKTIKIYEKEAEQLFESPVGKIAVSGGALVPDGRRGSSPRTSACACSIRRR